MAKPDLPIISFESAAKFRTWLKQHHTQPDGIWLKFYKKASGIKSITYLEALDEALCYGWIDGQVKSLDDKAYKQRWTPRRPRSIWSKRNIDNVKRLIKEKRMQPSGLAQYEAAKADGRLDNAYDPQKAMRIPQDFLEELARHPTAQKFFATLNRANKFVVVYQLQTAKRPETRERRLQKLIETLDREEKFY